MAATQGQTKGHITLKGSADIVAEFFGYGINSILYQRGIYPPEQFERAQKYGLTLLTTSDVQLKGYINGILGQLREWLIQKTVQKVVLVLTGTTTGEVMEQWQFDVQCDKSATESRYISKAPNLWT